MQAAPSRKRARLTVLLRRMASWGPDGDDVPGRKKRRLSRVMRRIGALWSGSGDAPEPPPELCCPITRDMFRDPVVTAAGHTYERSALLAFWRTPAGNCRDPMTNVKLVTDNIVPNMFVRQQVAAWMSSNPSYVGPHMEPLGPIAAAAPAPPPEAPLAAEAAAAAARDGMHALTTHFFNVSVTYANRVRIADPAEAIRRVRLALPLGAELFGVKSLHYVRAMGVFGDAQRRVGDTTKAFQVFSDAYDICLESRSVRLVNMIEPSFLYLSKYYMPRVGVSNALCKAEKAVGRLSFGMVLCRMTFLRDSGDLVAAHALLVDVAGREPAETAASATLRFYASDALVKRGLLREAADVAVPLLNECRRRHPALVSHAVCAAAAVRLAEGTTAGLEWAADAVQAHRRAHGPDGHLASSMIRILITRANVDLTTRGAPPVDLEANVDHELENNATFLESVYEDHKVAHFITKIDVLFLCGKTQEAVSMARATLETAVGYGANRARVEMALATTLLHAERYDEAADAAERVLRLSEECNMHADCPIALKAQICIAKFKFSQGDYDLGLALCEFVERRHRAEGRTLACTEMFFVANLRVSSLAEHDIDAAINLARTYIAELRVQVAPTHMRVQSIQAVLACALARRGDIAEAAELLPMVLEALVGSMRTEASEHAKCCCEAARALLRVGGADPRAADLARRALATWRVVYGADASYTLSAAVLLAAATRDDVGARDAFARLRLTLGEAHARVRLAAEDMNRISLNNN